MGYTTFRPAPVALRARAPQPYHPRMGLNPAGEYIPRQPSIARAAQESGGIANAPLSGATLASVASVALSAGGTWVGVSAGLREKGFLSFTGWTIGIVSAMGGLLSAAELLGLGVLAANRS